MIHSHSHPNRTSGHAIVSVVLAIIIVGGGLLAAKILVATAPHAERKPKPRSARLVEVVTAQTTDQQVTVNAMGLTKPASRIDLEPQVGGRLISLSPALEPGGFFSEDEQILQIEQQDYQLALRQRRSELKEAQSKVISAHSALITAEKELKVEKGNQQVAQREFELLGQDISEEDRELVLREPQRLAAEAAVESAQAGVESAQAALESAQAKLEEAQLDLERTTVRSPFNAVVVKRNVDLGDVVSSNTVLATLVGTDQFWVEVAVPVSQLRWIQIPDRDQARAGSAVRIYNETAWGPNVYRHGRVSRLVAELDPQSRMAKLLVTVNDPLASSEENKDKPSLLIGSYVRVEIEGPTLTDVIVIPRSLVWDGSTVRIMNDANQLEIRNITPLYQARDFVLVSGDVQPGESIITTDLSAAVEGLSLRTRQTANEQQPGAVKP